MVNGKQQDDLFILEQIKYEMKPFTVPAGQVCPFLLSVLRDMTSINEAPKDGAMLHQTPV